MIFMFPVN